MKRNILAGLGLGAMLWTACAEKATEPLGNGSIQTSERIQGLYVANGDESITRVDLRSGTSREFMLGREPSRIARLGSRVYVTLRNERALLVLEEDGTDLKTTARIPTAAEPFGVAATAERVFVAASTGGSVDEYDAATFERLRSWEIPGEPRWLALHPSNRALFVGSTYGGRLTRIDLTSGAATRVALPEVSGFNFQDGLPFTLTARVTGDIAVSEDGVYVPMLYVDNTTPIRDVDPNTPDEPNVDPCAPGPRPEPDGSGGPGRMSPPPSDEPLPGGPCGPGGYDNQKFNPVVTRVPVEEENGEVDPTQAPEPIGVSTFLSVVDANGFTIGGEPVSSYPSAVSVSPDGRLVFAALEGSDVVVAFLGRPSGGGNIASEPSFSPGIPGRGGSFSFRTLSGLRTGAAPRGIALIGSRLYVHAAFDRRVDEFDVQDVNLFLEAFQNPGEQPSRDILGPDGLPRPIRARGTRSVSSRVLDSQVEAGRRLFFAANNPVMATVGAGVSCGTCHFDGRTDGITWNFLRGPRQTPNLAANLREALPVGWAGNVSTVALEGFSTSQRLMGGQGLTEAHTASIEAFLFSTREIDTPFKGHEDEALQRGARLFSNRGCASCHSGAAYTDNRVYPMLGLERVKTRPLSGIAASAPYFHDGSAETLEEVVDRAARGEMGQPFSLTAEERADLVRYLKSL